MVDDRRVSMFDASVLDGDYMPTPVGGSPPAVEVTLLLLFCKDEHTAFELLAGMQPSDVTSRGAALERLSALLPVRGVLPAATRTQIAGEYLDAYATQVLPQSKLQAVYVAAMQDLWQYHACVAVGEAHAAALPGRTYLASLAYECKGKRTPHGADVSFLFGAMPSVPIHDKGKDFDGVSALVQQAYVAFARSGDPSTAAAPFAPFDEAAPRMTLIDSAVSGGGSKLVDTMRARDAAYRTLIAAIRAAEDGLEDGQK